MQNLSAMDPKRDWTREVYVSPHSVEKLRERCGPAPSVHDRTFMEAMARATMLVKDDLEREGIMDDLTELRKRFPPISGGDGEDYLFLVHFPASPINHLRQDGYLVVCRQRNTNIEYKHQVVIRTVYDQELLDKAVNQNKALTGMKVDMVAKFKGIEASRSMEKKVAEALSSPYALIHFAHDGGILNAYGFETDVDLKAAMNHKLTTGVALELLKPFAEVKTRVQIAFD